MNTIKNHYINKILPKLKNIFNISDFRKLPQIQSIIISSSYGKHGQDTKYFNDAINEYRLIFNRIPCYTVTTKQAATFRIKRKEKIGLMLTLRNEVIFEFLKDFYMNVLPRIRDFTGFSKTSFDTFGNYNFGLDNQLLFSQLEYDETFDDFRGFNITFKFNSSNLIKNYCLLSELGFPFEENSED